MASYAFPDVAGGSLVFSPAQDLLVFPVGWPAASVRFVASGGDLLVFSGDDFIRLIGIALGGAGLTGANLVFLDGSVLVLDGGAGGSNLRNGTDQGDWIGTDRGGQDTVLAGAGDDLIFAGAALDAGDSLDGGAGTGDRLALSGTLSVTLGPTTVVGVERFEVGTGDIALVLDPATVATATPAAGAWFTVDATAQGVGSRLTVDGSLVAAAGMALLGGGGEDSLLGGAGADSLAGGAGDDTLAGGAGDDTIIGGAGADVLSGGAGDDLFRWDEPGVQSPPATPDLILDFEGAGRAGGDRIALPSTLLVGRAIAFHVDAADFAFEGYDGSGVQLPPGRIGDGFADILWRVVAGEAWRFELWADLDDDGRFGPSDLFLRIAVPAGDPATTLVVGDLLGQIGGFVGGAGNDTLAGSGATDDAMWGEGGDDVLMGGDGVDWLDGGPGNDSLFGGDLADELRGGPGSDWLEGGDGWDTLFAADPHAPETEALSDRNMLIGGAGRDQLFGGLGFDTLDGGIGDDLLWGDFGDDWLSGGDGEDLLYGWDGADRLDGGAGDDTLLGGLGADVMLGGAGADLFIVGLRNAALPESTGAAADWLVDFRAAEGDRISLGLVAGLVGGAFGPGPLAWRGALAPRTLESGVGFGAALPGEGIGPGYYQAWWQPAVTGGVAAGGWFVIDLDQDLVLDIDDAVIRIGGPGTGGDTVLGAEAFLDGTFRVLVGGAGPDTLLAAASGQEVFGLGGADSLVGGAAADRLVGGEGNDTLLGSGGADQLWGGSGNDWLDGGAGDDEIFVEGPGIAEVDGFLARNTLLGGDGNDRLWGADGRESIAGGNGNDWLYGGIGLDTLRGQAGDDTIIGGDGADLIEGGPGADSIDAGSGDDTVDYDPADPFADGGDDTDLLVVTVPVSVTLDSTIDQVAGGGITRGFEGVDASAVALAVTLLGSSGRNRLIGGAGDDRIEGRDGNDTLEGGAGADTLDGGAGDDLVEGGAGADLMIGGAGIDTLSYANAAGAVLVQLFVGGTTGGWAAGDVLSGFEALRGSAFGDSLDGTQANDRLEGLGGDDTIIAFGGNDTVLGGDGDDRLVGGPGDDSILGGDGNDRLEGSEGNDVLDGGAGIDEMLGFTGNDLYRVDHADDKVVELEDQGQDTVLASVGYFLRANVEWIVLEAGRGDIFGVGNPLANTILGNEGRNRLIGHGGDDTIRGGEGNDRIEGRADDDWLHGDGGTDVLLGGDGADVLQGGPGSDTLYGENGNDSLYGSDEILTDYLYGGNGDDWLDGGGGYDVMYGGLGNDVFIASQQVEAIFENPGEGWDIVIALGGAGFTLPDNVEELFFAGPLTGIGNALSNRITGSALDERLLGRDGNDTLVGGGGNDLMWGEGGRDSFLFGPGSGVDAIRDFTPGMDRILLQGLGFPDFAAVMAATRDAGGGAIIDFSPTDAVQLTGVAKAALSAGDFAFLA
jgi:Ca2+-binding RTX toxin-like protein